MADSSFQVRPARLNDLPAYISLHQAAFDGSMGVELGERYVSEFLKWFITDSEALNLICESDGQLVGYAFGAPQGYSTRMNRALVKTIAMATIIRPWLFVRSGFLSQLPKRLRHLLNSKPASPIPLSDKLSKPLFRLVGLGVSPDFRRRGIGQQLMLEAAECTWARGYQELQLSVYEHNTGARTLYEMCGWKPLKSNSKIVTYQFERPSV